MTDKEKVEPKFNVGDKIRRKNDHSMTIDIKEIKYGCYVEGCEFYVRISEQDDWELVEEPSIPDIVDKHWFEMLGEEPILEVLAKYLDHVSHEEAMKTKGAIDRWFKEYFPEPVSKSLVDIEIPFGSRDSELIEESIAIPKGCHAVIEGNKVVIRKGEEPASEDLDEAADKYSQSIHSDYSNDMFDSHNIYDAVIYGAQWQKERDKDEIRMIRELLDNFDKTCDEYHDAGFKHGQEALMKDAVEGLVICDELTHYYKDIVMPIPDYLKVGDKVKLIIIKED